MNSEPVVSIITPVLNRRETIELCLDSVEAQTFDDLEHIVIDGGSTDGTLEVLEGRGSSRLQWISEPDSGMYDAINKGMRRARGRVLAYLNSDDLYLPWSIEAAVERLDQGFDFVYGDLGIVERTESGWVFYPQFYVPFDLGYYTHFATLGQPTVFWTRNALERNGLFDTSYKLLGDCEYWVRAATSGARFSHVHEVLALQIEHEQTLRATHPEKMRLEFERMRNHYGETVPRSSVTYAGTRRRLRWRWFQLQFILEGRLVGARWRRFMSFIRAKDIRLRRSGLLWFLLPEKLRPPTTLLDADRLMTALSQALPRDRKH